MAEEGCVEIGEANTGCKMEDSTTSLGGAPVVCLVCDCVIKELHRQDVPNVFLESSVTSHSQQQLANMLSVIIKSPLESSQVYSKTLCRRCFRLLDELDGIEQRSVVLKTTIEELYSRSLLRRMKGPRVSDEETIGAMDLGLPEDDEEDDGSKISVKVEPLDDDDDFLADELRPEDQGIRPDDPEFNPAHDNMWRSKSRSKGRGRGRGRSRGRARGRGRGRGPGRPPKNIKDEDAAANKAGESLGEKLGQLVNKILGDDESEEPVDMETETPTTSAEGVEEEVDATEKGEIGSLNVGSRLRVDHQCKWCDFSCPSPLEMATHTLTHAQHSCSECGLALARPSALKHHLKIVHNISLSSCDEKKARTKFPCDECGKVYASAGGLHSHKLGTHSGRVYSCKECGRKFNHPKNLASHVVRHRERNLKCTECSASFYLRSELNKHINQVHRKCRPYVCVDCGRSFCQRSVLKHHRMVHTDHRPLTCPICGRTFKHRHAFNYHLEQERKMAADSQEEGGRNNTALPSLMTVTSSTQTSEDVHTEEQTVNLSKVNSMEKNSDFTILTSKTDRKFPSSIETKSVHMPLLASGTDASDTHTGHYSAVELFGSSATFAIDPYNQSQRSVMLVTDINQDHPSIASFVLGAEGATDISPGNFKEQVDSSPGIHATSGISTLPDVELGHTEITCTTDVGAGTSRLDPEPTVSQYIKEGIEDCCVLSEDFISAYQATNAEVLTE
ncbi:zinc finger and BTB domain-containing protein 17-like isoform X2 [Penaeus chinensis]|nr:zinc finger and BTB domain-containing protein 17-like isoform X2 [Penaeus chinensis]XP_047483097.1 zinc finger and BTB domain-containing protein 17-like isoform X2 [Penaeus chinensis]XP_047483099.1 zinc finger and BTB domain-containing protein 17-like isoform X2 [Penaeus chinensis]